ncbi:Dabb family protein [Spirochaeta lutea]|uniref:Dabb family protein n=1 Tax=Spirochaeta lutea TaxID=1480694 RepID=UPI00055FB874|nr:Dabb family protein [Spirochaeta lutea]
MITHIVMWKTAGKNPAEKQAAARTIKEALESLPGRVPGIEFLDVGLDETQGPSSFDVVLTTRFRSWEDLQNYRVHPEHVAVGDVVAAHTEDRAVVDYAGGSADYSSGE